MADSPEPLVVVMGGGEVGGCPITIDRSASASTVFDKGPPSSWLRSTVQGIRFCLGPSYVHTEKKIKK